MTDKKLMTQQQYLKRSHLCPRCRSENVEAQGEDHSGDFTFQSVVCNDCGLEYTDEYQLTGYSVDDQEES